MAIPELEDPADELLKLVQGVRDLLLLNRSVGVSDELLAEDTGAPCSGSPAGLPLPPEPVGAAEVDPARVSRWSEIAQQVRQTQVPLHHEEGVGQEGLASVRADLGDCRRCGLCESRRQIVFGVGDPDADLMVIGEGPGEQEDLKGEPFVGPAGQMLDRMLTKVLELPRSAVYIANVVKCRPPDNRKPTTEEATTCAPFLARQVRAVRPKLILVLGGVALEHAAGLKGITRQRGQEIRVWGVPAIPTFHPAYLLRKPEDKRLTFEDLKQVRRRYAELGGRRPGGEG